MIAPSWHETLFELHRAESREELWAVLVLPHGIRSTAAWEEPYSLFSRLHEHDAEGAVTTAALLCTDHRWRKGARLLVEHLASSGLIKASGLDRLGEWFLLDMLLVSVSGADFDGDEIEIGTAAEGDHPPTARSTMAAPHEQEHRHGEVGFYRGIWPPLRRWAARHAVHRTPDRWRELVAVAQELPSRDGAAVAAGIMDAAGHIVTSRRAAVLEVGLGWGSGTVRLAALPGVADLHGPNAARARAARDPSAKVRAWAAERGQAMPLPDPQGGAIAIDSEGCARRVSPAIEPRIEATLF